RPYPQFVGRLTLVTTLRKFQATHRVPRRSAQDPTTGEEEAATIAANEQMFGAAQQNPDRASRGQLGYGVTRCWAERGHNPEKSGGVESRALAAARSCSKALIATASPPPARACAFCCGIAGCWGIAFRIAGCGGGAFCCGAAGWRSLVRPSRRARRAA